MSQILKGKLHIICAAICFPLQKPKCDICLCVKACFV